MNISSLLTMIERWEKRLVAIGVHDNQKCQGLWLKLYPDGSGSVMADYSDVKDGDDENEVVYRTVLTLESTELFGFDTIEELHGELVAKTMEIGT